MTEPAGSPPFICFVHIEKCGGITLSHLLQHNFPHFVPLRSWFLWSNEEGNYFRAEDLRRLRSFLPFLQGIGGHTTRTYADYEGALDRPVFTLAFFREPHERYLSHLNYQRDVMGVEWDVDSFLDEPRFNDYQTVRLAGGPDLDRAVRQLEERVDFVGLTERYDESLLLLRSRLRPWLREVCYERKNTGRRGADPVTWESLTEAQRSRVRENNALDRALYEHVTRETYPAQRERYAGDLSADLEEFREELRDFRYPPLRKLLQLVYRNVVRYVIQPLAFPRSRRRHG